MNLGHLTDRCFPQSGLKRSRAINAVWRASVAVLLTLASQAQPVITKLRYGPPLPILDGVTYNSRSPEIYYEYWDGPYQSNYSPTISLNTRATVTITWTGTNHSYAVYSTPDLGNWKVPIARNSPFLVTTNNSLTWTQSFCEGQRFFRVVER